MSNFQLRFGMEQIILHRYDILNPDILYYNEFSGQEIKWYISFFKYMFVDISGFLNQYSLLYQVLETNIHYYIRFLKPVFITISSFRNQYSLLYHVFETKINYYIKFLKPIFITISGFWNQCSLLFDGHIWWWYLMVIPNTSMFDPQPYSFNRITVTCAVAYKPR